MTIRPTQTVLTCAITGAGTDPNSTPYLPITPEQIATSALEAAEAGAAIVHIHVRDLETKRPSAKLELYEETVNYIKKYNTDVIINLTTGPGGTFEVGSDVMHQGGTRSFLVSAEQRVAHIEKIKPDLCSIDFNTMHQANNMVRINHRPVIKEMLTRIQAAGTKPELEIFDSGDFRIAQEFVADGTITEVPLWQFAMGVKYGWDHTFESLDYARRQLMPGSLWSAFGISREEMPFVAMTWCMGGHVRVGLEDNIYLEKGILAKSNAELVKKAVGIICDLGGTVADYRQARELYHIPKS
jgi:uncharacterized protein (DUF849 family)